MASKIPRKRFLPSILTQEQLRSRARFRKNVQKYKAAKEPGLIPGQEALQ